ncbi:PAS domain-containing protein [Halovivax gelatinilyticus]|uniref:PAS domain-containing protein n=1 Tax=Halovivax gelatinilyticus TaxID=2961597 RepID=UPI0020CA3F9B|nr:PAS domain-containing protein [Halovivax gelatinilyticus]
MSDQTRDGFFAISDNWRYTYVSDHGARLAEDQRDALLGERVWETFPELAGTEFESALRTAMETRESREVEAYYHPHDARYRLRAYPTENGLSVYFRDVTDLEERTEQFEAIFNNTHTFVGLLERDGTLRKANETALEFGGLDHDDVVGKPVWETYWFQSNQRTRETARTGVETARSGEMFTDVIRVQGSDREAVIDFSIRPITSEDGRVTHLIPEGRDITRRQELTEKLRQEREFIDKALDTLDDIFYVLTTEGTFRRWNSKLGEVTGYTDDEITEMRATEFFAGPDTDAIAAAIEETFTSGTAVVEAELQTKCGNLIPYEFTGARLTDTNDELVGLVGVGRDVSAKQSRERELRRKRKQLEALNQLNTVVIDITDAVIEQSTREEIERVTCEKLTDPDAYASAWIAEIDQTTGDVTCRVGRTRTSADEASPLVELPQPPEERSVRTTFQSGTVVTKNGEPTDSNAVPWHATVTDRTSRSFIAAPIVHEGTQFGVLGLHAAHANAFGERETESIRELGEIIGYVCYALRRKEALGSALELTFKTDRLATLFPSDEHARVDLSLEAVVPLDGNDEIFIEYWEINEAYAKTFRTTVDAHDPKLAIRLQGVFDGYARFEIAAGENSMSSAVAGEGGRLQSASLRDDSIHIVGEFPESVDPDAIASGLRETFPDIELVSQKRILTPTYLRRMVEESLTDRQRTVLQMAYFGDYFAHPRVNTGEELADNLGITKQTFHHHLRKAESAVFETLFEDPNDPLI